MRPERIDQVIPSIIEHDAVSNHTFEAQRLLRSMGFASEIFADVIGPGCDGRVNALRELSHASDGSQWLLYQASIGSRAAEVFARHPGVKLLDYHNITPPELVERWLPSLADEARLGRAQLAQLAKLCAFSLADSAYNATELDAFGFAHSVVVPVLVESGNFDAPADERTRTELAPATLGKGSRWLFVGQVAPHKAQHDVVRAFACYRAIYDPSARLSLVGRGMGFTYPDALARFVRSIGLGDVVDLPGSVPTEVLAAYYETAAVFVCCSEHEGFCAPVIEAMARGVPVVAYGAAALPETIGNAGIVLPRKDALFVAAAVQELLSEDALRVDLIERGRQRAGHYSLARAQEAFRAAITEAVALN